MGSWPPRANEISPLGRLVPTSAFSKLRYRQGSAKGTQKGAGAKKEVPQVTHWFPGSRRPSSPTCSRSGSASLSANSPVSRSGKVYNRRVPILPLDLLGHMYTTRAPFGCQENFFQWGPLPSAAGEAGEKGTAKGTCKERRDRLHK